MNAAGILRVGIFTLILSTTLIAETIPFDYWYGRIVGGANGSLSLFNGNFDRGRLTATAGVGQADRFAFRVWDYAVYVLEKEHAIYYEEPHFASKIQISKSLRLDFSDVSVRTSHGQRIWNQWDNSSYDSSSVSVNGTIEYLEGGGYDYSKTKSFRLWRQNPGLIKGQTSLKLLGSIESRSRDEGNSRPIEYEQLEINKSLRTKDFHQLEVLARHGVSSRLQLEVSGSYLNDRFHLLSESFETPREFYAWSRRYNEQRGDYVEEERRSAFVGGATYDFSSRFWLEMRGSVTRSEIFRDDSDIDVSFGREVTIKRVLESTYGSTEVSFVWIGGSKGMSIERLLDNYGRYYHEQLEAGAWLISGDARYVNGKLRSSNSIQDRTTLSSDLIDDSLRLAAVVRYYVKESMYVSFKSVLQLSTSETYYSPSYAHEKNNVNSLAFEYQSFTWSPEARRDISWSGISPLDYTMGPLLRARDFYFSLSMVLPRWVNTDSNDRRSLLSGNGGWRLIREWEVGARTALGVTSELQVAAQVLRTQTNRNPTSNQWSKKDWRLGANIDYQFAQCVRVTAEVSDDYAKYLQSGYEDNYQRTWNYSIRMYFLF